MNRCVLMWILNNPKVFASLIYVTQLGSGEDPELRNTLKNASYRGGRAAKCFKYSPNRRRWRCTGYTVQPRLSKLIMKEDKHTLTMTSGRLDLEEASFPVNSSVQAVGQCYRLPQPEVSASRETPRLTPRYLRTSFYRGLSSRRQHSPHPTTGGPLIG